jgi:DNA/RNA-binding domain of Phe-tRNA-synthetase-like protein
VPAFQIDPDIRPLVQVAAVSAGGVRSAPSPAGLRAEIAALCERLRSEHRDRLPSEIDALAPARELYRAFGIDPTSTRPSSEALLRRVLQGKPFPSVNGPVDVSNLCSATFLLPIGLYDAAKISGPVTLRRGRAGESYPGIRKDDVHLAGRPVLADDLGPFGNPTSDSSRTSVDASTASIWLVVFAPSRYPPDALISHETFMRDAIDRHLRSP